MELIQRRDVNGLRCFSGFHRRRTGCGILLTSSSEQIDDVFDRCSEILIDLLVASRTAQNVFQINDCSRSCGRRRFCDDLIGGGRGTG
jgi:hypothetical protein